MSLRAIGGLLALVLALLLATGGCATAGPTASPSAVATPAPTAALTQEPSTAPTPSPSPSATPVPSDPGPTVAPDSAFAPLDGLPANEAARTRLAVAIMVDDNVQARPQYGFNAASIVYQAPADGGEDRYMMVFHERNAKRVEPIRSGRPYFVNWATEYRAAFAHYGGDAKTLAYLPTLDNRLLYDVDALFGSASAFRRDGKRDAPHNGYTSSTAIRARAIQEGAPDRMPSDLGVRVFADDMPASERPAKGSIRVPYGRGATSYTYDRDTNQYLRSVAGKAQRDAADGKRVTARNVVVQFMRLSIDPESEPGYRRPVLDHIGTGKALVFRDGHVIKGEWRKASASALTRFFDASGQEISLVRGRIFIQVVPLGADVTYDAKG